MLSSVSTNTLNSVLSIPTVADFTTYTAFREGAVLRDEVTGVIARVTSTGDGTFGTTVLEPLNSNGTKPVTQPADVATLIYDEISRLQDGATYTPPTPDSGELLEVFVDRATNGTTPTLTAIAGIGTLENTNEQNVRPFIFWHDGTSWVPLAGDESIAPSNTFAALDDTDVLTSPPEDCQCLVWNNATSKWVPSPGIPVLNMGEVATFADASTQPNLKPGMQFWIEDILNETGGPNGAYRSIISITGGTARWSGPYGFIVGGSFDSTVVTMDSTLTWDSNI